MVFYMGPGQAPFGGGEPGADNLTPRQVVAELDRYIVGQSAAKRAVAIALRNRWRRRQLPPALAEEVLPKNILMIGPTGVGKTEIARRLARLTGSPFLKVEATKYTEVGYVGRDCESMVRDLVEIAIEMVRRDRRREVAAAAARAVEDRLLEALAGPRAAPASADQAREWVGSREELRARLRDGELEDRVVDVEVAEDAPAAFRIAGGPGMDEIDVRLGDMMPGMFGQRTRRRRMTVAEARSVLQKDEEERRLDKEQLAREAIARAEQSGIIFIDEIDKVAGAGHAGAGPDVSRQGVQRDLLPIVEGTIVQTKHGPVRTDHVLFVAAGAFHIAKPSDLIPELQGRFPIRVELSRLKREDLVRILREPENSLVRQYQALLQVEGVELQITDDAVEAIASLADEVNELTEDIGARRLVTILERVLDPVLFDAPDEQRGAVVIDAAQVRRALGEVAARHDLARYVL
ncbi:MAG: ATP-dependent protease ATPase subunit HslU [Acidobacteria bacterium]|nr:ATP-dependent protease ATPase subunit HslU [Acidobacteriota bacterium]